MDDASTSPAFSPAPNRQKNRRGIDRRPCVQDLQRVDRLLHSICHWFHRQHPSYHYEDLYSIACEAWADARASYSPHRGSKLSTWVYNRVRYALFGHHSRAGRDGARCRDFSNLADVTAALDAEGLPCGAAAGPEKIPDKRRFDPRSYLKELSADAAKVVELVWELVPAGTEPEGVGRDEAKALLAKALRELEWARDRFMAAVSEVREQLP